MSEFSHGGEDLRKIPSLSSRLSPATAERQAKRTRSMEELQGERGEIGFRSIFTF